METENVLMSVIIAVMAVVMIFGFYNISSNQIDQETLSNQVVLKVTEQINIPTAEEIAANVVIPEIVIPEQRDLSNDKLDDLWNSLYDDEVTELEDNAYDIAEAELEDDDYEILEDWFLDNVDGFDEIKDVDIEDYEVEIIDLGLDDDDDKVAEIVFELEVKYTLEEGIAIKYKKDMYITATVTFDEGDFDDESIDWLLPIELA